MLSNKSVQETRPRLAHRVNVHQLRVHQDVAAEDQRPEPTVDELARAAVRKEGGDQAEEDEDPEPAEQLRHPGREVVLGLAREQRQGEEDAEREHGGQQDRVALAPLLVDGHDDRDGVGLERGEAGQEGQVGRVRLALPVGQEHEPDAAEQRHPQQPAVREDPVAVGVADVGDRAERDRGEDLDGPAEEDRQSRQRTKSSDGGGATHKME